MLTKFIHHRSHSDRLEPRPFDQRRERFFNILVAVVLILTGGLYCLFPESTITEWFFGVAVWIVVTLYLLINLLSVVLITLGIYQSYVKEKDITDWMTHSAKPQGFWPMHFVTLFILGTLWYFDWTVTFWMLVASMAGCRLAIAYMRINWRRVKLGPVFG